MLLSQWELTLFVPKTPTGLADITPLIIERGLLKPINVKARQGFKYRSFDLKTNKVSIQPELYYYHCVRLRLSLEVAFNA